MSAFSINRIAGLFLCWMLTCSGIPEVPMEFHFFYWKQEKSFIAFHFIFYVFSKGWQFSKWWLKTGNKIGKMFSRTGKWFGRRSAWRHIQVNYHRRTLKKKNFFCRLNYFCRRNFWFYCFEFVVMKNASSPTTSKWCILMNICFHFEFIFSHFCCRRTEPFGHMADRQPHLYTF